MKKFIVPGSIVLALIVGTALGFVVGRAMLERQWSRTVTSVSQEEATTTSKDSDPLPSAGTQVLAALPLLKMREAAALFSQNDPVQVTLTSFGSGDDGSELHLMLKSSAPCTVTAIKGVAYAYDWSGKPVQANAGGKRFVAFESAAPLHLEKGGKDVFAFTVHHTETASLGVAHVDSYTCSNGVSWSRPKS